MSPNTNPEFDNAAAGLAASRPAAVIPRSFRDLAMTIAWTVYQDLHVNASGFAFFFLFGCGVLKPEVKAQCFELAGLAGTYLFASAKNK